MDERRRIGRRRMINVTMEQLACGALSPAAAAKALYAAGVPFNVIGRVTSASSAKPSTAIPRSAESQQQRLS